MPRPGKTGIIGGIVPFGMPGMDANDNKPKGKMTAYAFFVQICRDEHKRKHPDEQVALIEFTKKCSERWKTMNEKEKRRFNQMAEEDKKRYEVELACYGGTAPTGQIMKATKRTKKKKDPNAPKRSMSAFFWYSQDERGKVRAANPEFGVGDVAKELGRRWADAKPELKAKFEALAEKDRARYGKAKREYQLSLKNGTPKNVGDMNKNADEDRDSGDDESSGVSPNKIPNINSYPSQEATQENMQETSPVQSENATNSFQNNGNDTTNYDKNNHQSSTQSATDDTNQTSTTNANGNGDAQDEDLDEESD